MHLPNPAFRRRAIAQAILILLPVAAFGCSAATTEGPAPRAVASLDPAGLDALRDRVREDVLGGEIAGAVVVVSQRGDIALFESFGSRDLATGDPMTSDSIFRIYSMSKPIVSVAAMVLAERGALELDDPVGAYLPKFADLPVAVGGGEHEGSPITTEPARRAMTVRDLLRHTSGLTYGFFADTPVDRLTRIAFAAPDLAAFATRLAAVPLKHHPATRFQYSASTDLLGRLIEVVSERRLGEFLAAEVFAPLGMADTGFFVPEGQQHRLAGYYQPGDEGLAPVQDSGGFLAPPGLESGGGGLVSTASDYLRFCTMLLRGGELDGVRLLSTDSVAEMIRDQLPVGAATAAASDASGRPSGFGLGFAVTLQAPTDGNGSAGEFSWGGIASTAFWVDPVEEIIGIYMIQRAPFSPQFGQRFHADTYRALAR